MQTIGLETRGGIRIQSVDAIESKTVARASTCCRDLAREIARCFRGQLDPLRIAGAVPWSSFDHDLYPPAARRSEEHTSELQSLRHLVCRLLLEKKKSN